MRSSLIALPLTSLILALTLVSTLSLSACQPVEQTGAMKTVENQQSLKLVTLANDEEVTGFYAHWLTAQLLVLPKDKVKKDLYLARDKNQILKVTNTAQTSKLTAITTPDWLMSKYPHLSDFQAFKVNLPVAEIKQWLKSAPIVFSVNDNEQVKVHSFVQFAFLLDQLYTTGNNDADEVSNLGASITPEQVQFRLWAPTARLVELLVFDKNKQAKSPAKLIMTEDKNSGIWQLSSSAVAPKDYYQYKIEVYHPASEKIETIITTDPYSLSLSTNSQHSQVVDLSSANTQPEGWQQQKDNPVAAPEDNIFYETHIRDFSAHDPQLSSAKVRGKYAAFSEKNSAGIKHLRSLRNAGINNIHLLPTFDIGTANENDSQVLDLNDSINKLCQLSTKNSLCHESNINKSQSIREYLHTLPAETKQRQAIVSSIREIDNYNWGYDPFHYTVPEGSYANNPDGIARIIEFRQMVQSIHNLGFRVIMDVVYNHTHQAGLAPTTVLDKIVPNYYHRLDPISGKIAQSTCCDNTATERVMMEKLMTDSLVVWARDYKIDGFRFDLMAHQPKSAMLNARKAVQAVDSDTYFYGEGWNFGEVANSQRFTQASQLELSGTQIGTFTDRLRDAVRGGAFSASGYDIRKSQGIGSGLSTLPNELINGLVSQEKQQNAYLLAADQLRIGLAGNLANFPLENAQGEKVTGKDVPYGDQPTGYALDPADTINYVSKHDNQTLWDNNQYRLPYDTSTKDRVRIHLQSLAFPILAQGIPFLHMGSELLRSKSFLRDSYDYGDWFNQVDFTKQSNNYNVGLPPADKDESNWPLIKKLLERNEGRDHVSPSDITFSSTIFNEFIAIRMSTALFRLTTNKAIIQRVKFHNTGKEQQIGLIVMSIDDTNKDNVLDKTTSGLVVVFNTSMESININFAGAEQYQLHPIQKTGIDEIVKQSISEKDSFTVPPLTTSVFIKNRSIID